jgi:hypothetical protein
MAVDAASKELLSNQQFSLVGNNETVISGSDNQIGLTHIFRRFPSGLPAMLSITHKYCG